MMKNSENDDAVVRAIHELPLHTALDLWASLAFFQNPKRHGKFLRILSVVLRLAPLALLNINFSKYLIPALAFFWADFFLLFYWLKNQHLVAEKKIRFFTFFLAWLPWIFVTIAILRK